MKTNTMTYDVTKWCGQNIKVCIDLHLYMREFSLDKAFIED